LEIRIGIIAPAVYFYRYQKVSRFFMTIFIATIDSYHKSAGVPTSKSLNAPMLYKLPVLYMPPHLISKMDSLFNIKNKKMKRIHFKPIFFSGDFIIYPQQHLPAPKSHCTKKNYHEKNYFQKKGR